MESASFFNPPTTPSILAEWKHLARSISSVEISDSWNNRIKMGAYLFRSFFLHNDPLARNGN